jgi:hypothetical protein
MAVSKNDDTIGNTRSAGFNTAWDFKGQYVSDLAEDSLERFGQYSATPDSTMLFAGPARFTGLAGDTAQLTPIGLTDGISMSSSPQLQRLYEIGSNRAFFTRGKTMSSVSFSRVLADQQNILMALSANTYRPLQSVGGMNGPSAQPNPGIGLNLDSEYFSTPFGLMLLFKTRGGPSSTGSANDNNGKILSAIYLEFCMFSNYSFGITNGSPIIAEGLSIEFDRVVPVAMTN